MNKAFDNFTWADKPSTVSPMKSTNLNKINSALNTIDDRVIVLDNTINALVPAYDISLTLDKWNIEIHAGRVTPNLLLPTPNVNFSQEIRYIFTAQTINATFKAPENYILGTEDGFAGLSAGNTITINDLNINNIYEVSFMVLDDSHIGFIKKLWKTS